jgi:hypothetical protein
MDSVKLHMGKSLDDRYQFQPWYIKLYRQLRWGPQYWLLACYIIIKWFITFRGQIPQEERDWFVSRCDYVKHLWRLVASLGSMKMKHYYTLDEVMENCKRKIQCLNSK